MLQGGLLWVHCKVRRSNGILLRARRKGPHCHYDITDPDSKRRMLRIADDHEALATRREAAAKKSSKAPPCDGQRHEARRDCATSWRERTCILSLIKNTDESSCRSRRLRSSNCAACC